jgi:hypothetical protein
MDKSLRTRAAVIRAVVLVWLHGVIGTPKPQAELVHKVQIGVKPVFIDTCGLAATQ